ncbi:MAG: archaemetzincin [Akkermansiaceae bacterium]|nr:archaemetzincin [Akkermansiaceae bacterium]
MSSEPELGVVLSKRSPQGMIIVLLSAAIVTLLIVHFVRADRGEGWNDRAEAFVPIIGKLRPLHQPLGPPKPGEWLANNKEPGQTFRQYVTQDPIRPTDKRGTICILPIGDFTEDQLKVVKLTAEYMEIFYSLPVKMMDALPDDEIPEHARRVHPTWGDRQFLSTYILDEVLKARLPKDGCVILGLTATDLWPGDGWNFVFGQASIRERVGVWSIYRKGDPSLSEDAFRLCLLRTIKTAVHETGHMFSIRHCTAYECLMCGSNSLPESDGRPVAFCPECMAKVCWVTKADPLERMKKLAAFCKEQGFESDLKLYSQQISVLEGEGKAGE